MIKRHGDIPLYPVEKFEGEEIKHQGSFVLAEGETTGHKHVISVPKLEDMQVFRDSFGGIYLVLKSEATVAHEEHKAITVLPGVYKVGKEREKDWFSLTVHQVID